MQARSGETQRARARQRHQGTHPLPRPDSGTRRAGGPAQDLAPAPRHGNGISHGHPRSAGRQKFFDAWFGTFVFGPLASGGSSLWNSLLGYTNEVKKIRKDQELTNLERFEAKRRTGHNERPPTPAENGGRRG